jgi:hypothetical protein
MEDLNQVPDQRSGNGLKVRGDDMNKDKQQDGKCTDNSSKKGNDLFARTIMKGLIAGSKRSSTSGKQKP